MLEACAKSCGPAFHAELGKFKFLNEMIKLVKHSKSFVVDVNYTVWVVHK